MKKKLFVSALSYTMVFICLMLLNSCQIDDWSDIFNKHEVGDTLWIHESSGGPLHINKSLALANSGSIIYAEGGTTVNWKPCRIVSIHKKDGITEWISPELDHIGISSQIMIGDDGTIYVIGYYTLYAIDPGTGQFKWKWEVPETLPHPDIPGGTVYTKGQIGALALNNKGEIIVGSIGSGVYWRGIYCLKPDGQLKWYNLKVVAGMVISNFSIGKDGHIFYFTASGSGKLFSVDGNTGNERWRIDSWSGNASANNILVDHDGTLLATFKKSSDEPLLLHRIDPLNGNIIWSSTENAESGFSNKWLGADGVVYQHFPYDGGMNRYDMLTGSRSTFLSTEYSYANAIGAINDKEQLHIVYHSSGSVNRLGAFNKDGSLEWSFAMGGLDAPPLLISDQKVIYSIINDHPVSYLPTRICAIQGNAKLAKKGWPVINHDNRNTCNVNK